jgi:hypothetical protein
VFLTRPPAHRLHTAKQLVHGASADLLSLCVLTSPLALADLDAIMDTVVTELGDSKKKASSKASTGDADALPVSARIKNLIRGIDDPDHPYTSRSEAVFAVVLAMLGAGCTDDQIEAVLLDPSYPIAAHVLDQSKPGEYPIAANGSSSDWRRVQKP